jgi:hypothetical protein
MSKYWQQATIGGYKSLRRFLPALWRKAFGNFFLKPNAALKGSIAKEKINSGEYEPIGEFGTRFTSNLHSQKYHQVRVCHNSQISSLSPLDLAVCNEQCTLSALKKIYPVASRMLA